MLEWVIQSRGRVCARTGSAFEDKAPCHTVLLQSQMGYERLDLCQSAWEAEGPVLVARPNHVSHWRGVYHSPAAAPPEVIGRDDAEGLLRRLLELRDESYSAAAFVLAAMLERKRVLKIRSEVREGSRRIFVYEHARNGDVLAVADPGLHLDQLAAVQRQVTELLTAGLPAPSAPVPSAAEVPSPGAGNSEMPEAEPAMSEQPLSSIPV